ncbi:hypothetical protein [Streptomyces sp. DH7]|uniref:hypothetical protein n=1 Tax=Streptomyces sp. DH7 TaxID=2857006 RepID=UPI001E2FB2C3|nr:hypothetical protein [Streptomyces sp. DH7]
MPGDVRLAAVVDGDRRTDRTGSDDRTGARGPADDRSGTGAPPPTAPAPVAASRRSVLLLAAAVGGLAVACLLYVLVDRPGLREPLEAAATVVAAAVGVAGFVWGISRATR